MQDGDDSQRPGEATEADIHPPGTASAPPTPHGFVSRKGAATMVAVALLVGAALGWVGSGVGDETANPDLQALCATLGELDIAVLDRVESGEADIGGPNLARLGALHSLAVAAASHPDLPEALAETGGRLNFEMSRGDFEGVREQVGELRQHC